MGKVYEALNRAQGEVVELDPFDELEEEQAYLEADLEEEQAYLEQDQEPSAEQMPVPVSGKFNFMRYSLGATSVADRDRPRHNPEAALVRTKFQPGRELTVNPGRLDPHLVSFYNADPRASDQYNRLALNLISRSAERGFKRVLVASAGRGDGRTCVTLNLACSLARARQRVLVVDCDFSNPSVMRTLGMDCDLGLVESFERGIPPSMAMVKLNPYGFSVLPTCRPVSNPAQLLAAAGLWKMLKSFDADYDFVLFDSTALLDAVDSSLLVRFTGNTLLVVRAGATSSSQMAAAIAPFSQDDILGVVMNRASS
jgi:Mrp family chromosome partitioning ATPase